MCQTVCPVLCRPNRHCSIYFSHINRQNCGMGNKEGIWIMHIIFPYLSAIMLPKTMGREIGPNKDIEQFPTISYMVHTQHKYKILFSLFRKKQKLYVCLWLATLFREIKCRLDNWKETHWAQSPMTYQWYGWEKGRKRKGKWNELFHWFSFTNQRQINQTAFFSLFCNT